MNIAIVAGGFKPGEADELRRAMATFKRTGTIGNYRDRMINGMVGKGYTKDFAERCSSRSRALANMAFPKATPPPSPCSSMPPAGSRPSIPTCSAPRS
jgi:error-prone DNA polymerase